MSRRVAATESARRPTSCRASSTSHEQIRQRPDHRRTSSSRLDGVNDALLVERDRHATRTERRAAPASCARRTSSLLVVKNSLARRATEGTPLAAGLRRHRKARWPSSGAAKTSSRWPRKSSRIAGDKEFAAVRARRRRDGRPAARRPTRSTQVSKWPSREEQLSILVGQILAPGASLSAQLARPRRQLASQIKKKGEGAEDEAPRRSSCGRSRRAGSGRGRRSALRRREAAELSADRQITVHRLSK